MKRIFHVVTEREPGKLHGDETQAFFGTHLALQVDATDEETARGALSDFLTELLEAEFHLFQLKEGELAWVQQLNRTTNLGAPVIDAAYVMSWLNSAKQTFVQLNLELPMDETPGDDQMAAQSFYAASAEGQRNMSQARAVDLLRATAKWPAPLPQSVGLTVPLHGDVPEADKKYVIACLEKGLSKDDVTLTITENANGDEELPLVLSVTADSRDLYDLSTAIFSNLKPLPQGCQDDGTFDLPEFGPEMARLLTRIEERAPSLLTLSGLLDEIAMDPSVIRAIHGLANDVPLTDETILDSRHLNWIMRASVLTLFDVPLAGLHFVPTVDWSSPPRGAILQRLVRLIADDFETTKAYRGLEVDETKLYANLHARLMSSDHVGDMTPETLWESLEPLVSEKIAQGPIPKALVSVLPSEETTYADWKTSLVTFFESLAHLSVFLESETGAEAWILSRLDKAFLNDATFDASLIDGSGIKSHIKDVVSDLDAQAAILAGLPEHLTTLYQAFRRDIEGAFNGAEALRRDFGAWAVMLLTAEDDFADPSKVVQALAETDWFVSRCTDDNSADVAGAFEPMRQRTIPLGRVHDAISDAVKSAFEARVNQITGDLIALSTRFEPDATPHALMFQIAQNTTQKNLDEIADLTSGLGFAIAVVEPDATLATTHASLVALRDRDHPLAVDSDGNIEREDGWWLADPTVLPIQPVLTPGATGLFVRYDGTPIASPNRVVPGQGGALMDADQFRQMQAEAGTRGYVIEDSQKAARLPALAYGKKYGLSAYWVPPSGVLPVVLRDETQILRPKPTPSDLTFAEPTTYLRRTAVTDCGITKVSVPEGVFPLCMDDPRLVLESFENGKRHLDLFRRADGTGAITPDFLATLPVINGDPVIRLSEVTFSAGLDVDNLNIVPLSVSNNAQLHTVSVEVVHTGTTLAITVKDLSEETPVWLRLSWRDKTPTGCLSFDDPAHDEGPGATDRQGSVLVLAPDTDDWVHGRGDTTIEVCGPQVSFADLECWARNKTLWKNTTGGSEERSEQLLKALTFAQMLLTASGSEDAEKLKRMPDPAVRSLILSAATSDEIAGNRKTATNAQVELEINPYAEEGLHIPEFEKLPSDPSKLEKSLEVITKELVTLVDEITRRARKTVRIGIGTDDVLGFDTSDVVPKLSVAKGWVARLSIHPGVSGTYFDEDPATHSMDKGLLTLAVGEFADLILFDGPKIQIEAMRPLQDTDVVEPAQLVVSTAGFDREYALDFAPLERHRIFGEAQLMLQQWAPTGRPIYRWISPVPTTEEASGPVVEIRPDATVGRQREVGQVTQQELEGFEADAFFEVNDDALDRKPVLRLEPAPGATRLWTQAWPERSATYFRHRLSLRTRYAAAMQTNEDVWRTVTRSERDPWIARIAILADPLRGKISRPQLRALIPMQDRPDTEQHGPSAVLPVTCVMEEPPFAQLGLADRVCADLKTTPTYGFSPADDAIAESANPEDSIQPGLAPTAEEEVLQVKDLRKQLGGDPRLTYYGVSDPASRQASLSLEGPVGTHFGSETARAPRFVNSQFLMQANIPNSDIHDLAELEESFLAVEMSRYAAPEWSFVPRDLPASATLLNLSTVGPADRMDHAPLQPDIDAWITPNANFKLVSEENDVAQVDHHNGITTVRIMRTALMEQGGDGTVTLIEAPGPLDRFALLLRSLSDNRYVISVFADPVPSKADDDVRRGAIQVPQLLATAEVTASGQLQIDPPMKWQQTRQSDATLMRWVRTARDMSVFVELGEGTEDTPVSLNKAVAVLRDGRLQFEDARKAPLSLASPVSLRRYPLHVHRRLAMLLRRPTKQIGHEMHIFDRALLADAYAQVPVTDPEGLRGAQVSILEMETRAEITYVEDNADPGDHLSKYAQATFDLHATRPADGPDRHIRQMLFHIRAANQPLQLGETSVVISAAGGDAEEVLTLGVTSPTQTWSLDLMIRTKDGQNPSEDGFADNAYEWSFGLPGGDWRGFQDAGQIGAIFKLPAIALTVKRNVQVTPGTPTWLDVSALHSHRSSAVSREHGAIAMDFDWIFGAVDGSEDLESALSPETLSTLPEAQARLVGHSPPLPLLLRT